MLVRMSSTTTSMLVRCHTCSNVAATTPSFWTGDRVHVLYTMMPPGRQLRIPALWTHATVRQKEKPEVGQENNNNKHSKLPHHGHGTVYQNCLMFNCGQASIITFWQQLKTFLSGLDRYCAGAPYPILSAAAIPIPGCTDFFLTQNAILCGV